MSLTQSWLFLAGSILCEVAGTSIMKLSQAEWPVLGMLCMLSLIAVSYFFLAKAVVKLPIGVAYSLWEGLGLILILLVSVLVLGETMNALRFLALGLIFGGILLVHNGTEGEHHASSSARSRAPAPELQTDKTGLAAVSTCRAGSALSRGEAS